jgi:hypothetical protein
LVGLPKSLQEIKVPVDLVGQACIHTHSERLPEVALSSVEVSVKLTPRTLLCRLSDVSLLRGGSAAFCETQQSVASKLT